MEKLTQKELDNTMAGKKNIDLSNLDLRNLSFAGFDLSNSDLSNSNLTNAKLSFTNLTDSNLTGADLTNANLMGACLWDAIGNDLQIKNIDLGLYPICYTRDILQIGCENHKINEWFNFDDKTINEMDHYALKWWKQNKAYIFETINSNPAKR